MDVKSGGLNDIGDKAMLEKRQAVRYRVGEDADVVIYCDGGNMVAPLIDLSQTGMMTGLPESIWTHFPPGHEVNGQLRCSGDVADWQGRVVHRTVARCGSGIGIAFTDGGVFSTVREIVRQPGAGGVHLRREEQGLVLEVYGRLSFMTSRDCLAYVRHDAVGRIDLTHCSSIDSAGLGMLCLARDRRIAISGAQGAVENLLAIAHIAQVQGGGAH